MTATIKGRISPFPLKDPGGCNNQLHQPTVVTTGNVQPEVRNMTETGLQFQQTLEFQHKLAHSEIIVYTEASARAG